MVVRNFPGNYLEKPNICDLSNNRFSGYYYIVIKAFLNKPCIDSRRVAWLYVPCGILADCYTRLFPFHYNHTAIDIINI